MALYRTSDGYAYLHTCTGTYDVSRDGATITWHPSLHAHPDTVRTDVANRVLAVALHAAGVLTLHGSGIAFDSEPSASSAADDSGACRAIVFLADKGTGKSTLAAALVNAGGRLVSDDTLAVVPGDEPHAGVTLLPGVPHLRLRDDSAAHIVESGAARGMGVVRGADGKHVVTDLDARRMQSAEAALSAIYVLTPAPPDQEEAVRRELMGTVPATIALVQHAKLAPLLGGDELPTLLDRAAELSRRVPVYRLHVARDLARVQDASHEILRWHAGANAVAAH